MPLGEVIFDRNCPEQPPDLIFSPKDDSAGFSPNLEHLPVSVCVCVCGLVMMSMGNWMCLVTFQLEFRRSLLPLKSAGRVTGGVQSSPSDQSI